MFAERYLSRTTENRVNKQYPHCIPQELHAGHFLSYILYDTFCIIAGEQKVETPQRIELCFSVLRTECYTLTVSQWRFVVTVHAIMLFRHTLSPDQLNLHGRGNRIRTHESSFGGCRVTTTLYPSIAESTEHDSESVFRSNSLANCAYVPVGLLSISAAGSTRNFRLGIYSPVLSPDRRHIAEAVGIEPTRQFLDITIFKTDKRASRAYLHQYRKWESNPQGCYVLSVGGLPFPVSHSGISAPQGIRTHTGCGLNALSLPIGLEEHNKKPRFQRGRTYRIWIQFIYLALSARVRTNYMTNNFA